MEIINFLIFISGILENKGWREITKAPRNPAIRNTVFYSLLLQLLVFSPHSFSLSSLCFSIKRQSLEKQVSGKEANWSYSRVSEDSGEVSLLWRHHLWPLRDLEKDGDILPSWEHDILLYFSVLTVPLKGHPKHQPVATQVFNPRSDNPLRRWLWNRRKNK